MIILCLASSLDFYWPLFGGAMGAEEGSHGYSVNSLYPENDNYAFIGKFFLIHVFDDLISLAGNLKNILEL